MPSHVRRWAMAAALLAAASAGAVDTSAQDRTTLDRIGFLLPPSAPAVVFFYQLAPGVAGDVTGSWIAVDVGDAAPPGYLIDSLTVTLPAGGEASFTLGRPNRGWPLGKYRLELRVDGRLVAVEPFVIQEP